ncbi:MAG: hypothetical protein EHM58_08665 [Ignavibacteriae bacterium]|nr:MAG: hypothetical protein EHM58_08665 [Ignavibacteriota bacterium]
MIIYNRESAISKAQIELWEIKEEIAEEVKDLSLDEKLKYVIDKSRRAREEYDNSIRDRKRRKD